MARCFRVEAPLEAGWKQKVGTGQPSTMPQRRPELARCPMPATPRNLTQRNLCRSLCDDCDIRPQPLGNLALAHAAIGQA